MTCSGCVRACQVKSFDMKPWMLAVAVGAMGALGALGELGHWKPLAINQVVQEFMYLEGLFRHCRGVFSHFYGRPLRWSGDYE